jgi:hypothetical protein
MSNRNYREPIPFIETLDDPKNVGLASGSMIAILVAFIFGTCLFVSLDALHPRYPAAKEGQPITVSLARSDARLATNEF